MAPFGPIGQDDYSVHVVGHDNESVQINAMVMRRQVFPCLLDDRAHFIQSRIAVDDFTEEHDAILRASRSLANAGNGGLDEGRWALMLAEQVREATFYHSPLQISGL